MRAEAQRMSLARDITTVGGGTLLSRMLAYARDAGIAALLGTGPISEAFFIVLQVVNFFRRLLADGALNGAFVPIWLALRRSAGGAVTADTFTRSSLLVIAFFSGIATLVVCAFAHPIIALIAPGFDAVRGHAATLFLLGVSFYIPFAAAVAVLAAALNAEGKVRAVVVSTVSFNIVMLLGLGLAHNDPDPLRIAIWLSGAILMAGVVQFLITGTAWLFDRERWQRGFPRVRVPDQTHVFFRRVLPGLIAAGVPQLKLIAATAIVSATPAAVSWLYYANRLYELPLGVASVGIAAVMGPRIAAVRQSGGGDAFSAAQSRACEIALGLALPAAAGFALLAPQIVGGLFEHGAFGARDSEAVSVALIAICAGLPGHVLEKIFGAVSFAHEDTRTPMLTALCALAAAIVSGVALFPRYDFVGVAAAIAISGWVGAALLGGILRSRGWLRLDDDAWRRLPRIALATLIMGLVVAGEAAAESAFLPGLSASGIGRLAWLAVMVAVAVVVYAVTLQILGVLKFKDMLTALRGED
jgi:putative peptidoglycan lipid II flippase